MDSTDVSTVVSAGAAVFSAAAAFGAWRAGSQAGGAAQALTKIETARRWQELTPQFSWQLGLLNKGGTAVRLVLELDGPLALRQLESLTVRIRDDRAGRADELHVGNGPSAEQIRAQVWGPYRFTPGVGPGASPGRGGADANGRSIDIVAVPLVVGEGLQFQLEPTRPPEWMAAEGVMFDADRLETDWRQLVGDQLRLTVMGQAEGTDPWVVPLEISAGTPTIEF